MRPIILLAAGAFGALLLAGTARAAGPDSGAAAALATLDQKTEEAVVRMDFDYLKKAYAEDFTFTHSTGDVQDRKTWLASVARGYFRERKVDAVTTELHGDIALTIGRITVHEIVPTKDKHYAIRYIRVYAWRDGRWQLVSHRSTEFKELP